MTIINPEPADRHKDTIVNAGNDYVEREEIVVDEVAQRRIALARVSQLIWLAAGVLETLFAIRVFLRLIAANPNAPFAQMLYLFTGLFLFPFQGLTITPSVEGAVLEISTLIAMIVYALAAWAVVQLLWVIFYRTYTTSRNRTTQRINR